MSHSQRVNMVEPTRKATQLRSHPHPLRSNPTVPDTISPDSTPYPTQDVEYELTRQPCLRRTSSLRVPMSPQPIERSLRRANTFASREAGLAARQQQPMKTDCGLTRQPAVRRPNPPIRGGVSTQGRSPVTKKVRFIGNSHAHKEGNLNSKEAMNERRPFSFVIGVDSPPPAKDLYLQSNAEKRQPIRGYKGDESRMAKIPETDDDHDQDQDQTEAKIRHRLLRSALKMDSKYHAELITLNNRLRGVAEQLDDVQASQPRHKLVVPLKTLKATKVKLTDFITQFRRLPVPASSCSNALVKETDSEDPATEIEQWRELVEIALATIADILNENIEETEQDQTLKLDLKHFVEDVEEFVLSVGRSRNQLSRNM